MKMKIESTPIEVDTGLVFGERLSLLSNEDPQLLNEIRAKETAAFKHWLDEQLTTAFEMGMKFADSITPEPRNSRN